MNRDEALQARVAIAQAAAARRRQMQIIEANERAARAAAKQEARNA